MRTIHLTILSIQKHILNPLWHKENTIRNYLLNPPKPKRATGNQPTLRFSAKESHHTYVPITASMINHKIIQPPKSLGLRNRKRHLTMTMSLTFDIDKGTCRGYDNDNNHSRQFLIQVNVTLTLSSITPCVCFVLGQLRVSHNYLNNPSYLLSPKNAHINKTYIQNNKQRRYR